jgi:hypothetical protein
MDKFRLHGELCAMVRDGAAARRKHMDPRRLEAFSDGASAAEATSHS